MRIFACYRFSVDRYHFVYDNYWILSVKSHFLRWTKCIETRCLYINKDTNNKNISRASILRGRFWKIFQTVERGMRENTTNQIMESVCGTARNYNGIWVNWHNSYSTVKYFGKNANHIPSDVQWVRNPLWKNIKGNPRGKPPDKAVTFKVNDTIVSI